MKFIHSELNRRKLKAEFFGDDWSIRSNNYQSNSIKIDLSQLSLQGKHQKINASLAIHLARNILKNKFNVNKTQKALTLCQWPGRMQPIRSGLFFRKLKRLTSYNFRNIN